MKSLLDSLNNRFEKALISAFGDGVVAKNGSKESLVVPASNPSFGDFQCNSSLALSKELKQSPRQIADKILEHLDISDICETPTIAGPGFINLSLKSDYIAKALEAVKSDSRLGVPKAAKAKNVVIDMSSPNIAKQMHVGHLRSTIIGESISRVIEFLGHKVLRVNHVGDWGTQFGMLITYLAEVCPEALTTADHIDIGDLVTFYKQAKVRFDEDEDFKTRSRQAVVKLQSGDEGSLHAWKLLCDQSRREFQEIYDTLGIENLIERGESFYNPMLEQVVEDLTKLGLLTEDQGALCVFLDEFKGKDGKIQPCIVRKTDGGFNYATTDLAALRYRVTHDKADQMIYVIDVGQSEHLKQVFTVARKAGFVPPEVEIEHIPFGLVLGEDGKKLKTRSGETIRLKELLDEAVLRARADIESRIDAEGRTETEQFKEEVSTAVGIGAVKYADLCQNRITNYMFSFDKMLALQGNTAPYMMYAYVRVQGISRKGGIDFSKLGSDAHIVLKEDAEVVLAKHLLQLDEVLESVATEGMPNRLCQYLFELSQKFNVFYDNCPVLNAEEPTRTSRLILCDITARTIKLGLSLLGISVLERM